MVPEIQAINFRHMIGKYCIKQEELRGIHSNYRVTYCTNPASGLHRTVAFLCNSYAIPMQFWYNSYRSFRALTVLFYRIRSGKLKAEGGRLKAKGGRQKAEGKRRKAEGETLKAKGKRHKAEGTRRKAAKRETRNAERRALKTWEE